MKPKTARCFLSRNLYKIVRTKVNEGLGKTFKLVKPYLKALETDLGNKASERVYSRIFEVLNRR